MAHGEMRGYTSDVIVAAFATLLAFSTPAFPLAPQPATSFQLEQPDVPSPENFSGLDESLYGQTPRLRFVHYGAPADRNDILRRIRYARDYYRHAGLLVSAEESVYEIGGTNRSDAEARLKNLGLWESGRTVLFSSGTLMDELGQVLGVGNPAAMRKLFAFPPPQPATDFFHRPASRDYRLTEADRRIFELGLKDAERMSPLLYPGLIPRVDAVLYDTESLEIYSYNHDLPLPKVRRWRGYQIYRVAHHARPEEHEMAICSGGVDFVRHADYRQAMGELYFACAGWGSFKRMQKKRRSIYRFVDGYRASIIHEYGHQYQALMEGHPTREMLEIQRLIDSMKLPNRVDAESAAHEGFANWCELRGAKKLYSAQYRRMLDELRHSRSDDAYGHLAGLAAAAMVEQNP